MSAPSGPGWRVDGPRQAAGGCLCGAVRYRIEGPVRDVLVCHCSVCRRSHGHAAAYCACRRDQLAIDDVDGALAWHEHDGARRAFCRRCGGRLFWERPGRDTVSIAAGTLDEPTGLVIAGHSFREAAADYEDGSQSEAQPIAG